MSAHADPLRGYLATFAGLLALTALTVAVAFVDLGAFNTAIALGIAGGKAALVALVFMHLARSSRLTWLVAVGGVAWLVLLIGLVLLDVGARPIGEPGPLAPR